MNLKIAIVTQYFYPEHFIINDIVRELVRQGHTVEIFTGKPNYPDGIIYDGYSAKGCTNEIWEDGVKLHRVPMRPRLTGGAKNLALNYLSFLFNGLFFFPGSLKKQSFDAIIVYGVSPITAAVPAILMKFLTRAHLFVWVQDLWPESLKATGFIKNSMTLRLVGLLVKGIYAFADTILVQSKAFVTPVMKYAKANKIFYYPNSYRKPTTVEVSESGLPSDFIDLLERNFCVVFSGNLGHAQSLDTLIDAAIRLKHLSELKIVIVGSGSRLRWLQDQKKQLNLDNVILPGRFPASAMDEIFEKSKGLLVTLTRDEIFSYTVPSKVQAYMAAGRPLLAALDGEGARVIEESGAGLCSRAEDAASLAQNIEVLYNRSPEERDIMGEAGFRYFSEHFEMQGQCQRLVEIIKKRIADQETH